MNRPAAAAADAVCVLAFVAVGSRNHDSGGGVVGVLGIGLPFWIALVAVWTLPVVRREPLSVAATTAVWASTVAGGMLLRNLAFGDGTAAVFVLVTAGFLGAAMSGWRAVARRRVAA